MNKNKKKDMKPFDMNKKPCKQSIFLLPLIWICSYLDTRKFKLKIEKENMKGIKPPYLVLSMHQGFSDYSIAPLSVAFHRANYVSDMEGFANYGERLYRKIGCIGKRRYVSDISVVKNIKHVINKNKNIVFIFPESRHSNVGTTALIPKNMGKLVKMLNVPLVILSIHGSYLANPFWNEENTRKVPMKAKLKCLYNKEELKTISKEELQKRIEEELKYDEYEWQKKENIKIDYDKRAEGLEKVLYKCYSCKKEFEMKSHKEKLICNQCGKEWKMTEYGELEDMQTKEKIHIPNWYEWEKKEVEEENLNDYVFKVHIEALPSEKGFVNLGEGTLKHTKNEFVLIYDDKEIKFNERNMESVQTEYNYKNKGMCIVLSTKDCCYYIYSKDKKFNPTKIQFITENNYKNNEMYKEIR